MEEAQFHFQSPFFDLILFAKRQYEMKNKKSKNLLICLYLILNLLFVLVNRVFADLFFSMALFDLLVDYVNQFVLEVKI
jgi:hypothetical protein